MAQEVEIPTIGILEFPEDMSQEQIAAAIQKNFPHLTPPASQPSAEPTLSTAQLPQAGSFEEWVAENYPNVYGAWGAAKETPFEVVKMMGVPEITEPIARTAARLTAETPAAKEAIGMPSGREWARSGLYAGSLAMPYGKIATGIAAQASKFIPKTLAGLAGTGAAGATGGYMFEAGRKIGEGELPTPGGMTAISALIPPVIRGGIEAEKAVKTRVGKVIGGVWPSIREGKIKKEIGRELIAKFETGEPVFAKNMEEAQQLKSKFPGLTFSYAEASDLPTAIEAEKTLLTTTDAGKVAKSVKTMKNNEAILNRIDEAFKGEEGIGDVIELVGKKQTELTRGREVAEISYKRAGEALKEGRMLPEQSGTTLLQRASNMKKNARTIVEDKSGKIPNDILLPDSSPIASEMADIRKQPYSTEPAQYPTAIMNRIDDIIKPREPQARLTPILTPEPASMTMGQAREIRSQISTAIKTSNSPEQEALRARLGQLRSGIDKTIDQLKNSPNAQVRKDYRDFVKYYKEEYVPIYKQGTTAEILSKTKTYEQKVDDALIASEYLQPGLKGVRAIKDFKKTFGDDTIANKAIKDYAIYDLLQYAKNPDTQEISTHKIMAWIHNHNHSIKELGLWNELKNIKNTNKLLKEATEMENIFNEGYASKILGVDAASAISNIIGKGKKDSKKAADEIMKIITNIEIKDPNGATKAIRGLQNATKKYIINRIETSMPDVAGQTQLKGAKMADLMDELDPSLRVIFRRNPSKLTALKETRQVLDTIRRGSRNIISGGSGGPSETAAFLASAVGKGMKISLHSTIGPIPTEMLDITGRLLKKYNKKEIDKLWANALLDPDTANDFMRMAKKEMTTEEFENKYLKTLSGGLKEIQPRATIAKIHEQQEE